MTPKDAKVLEIQKLAYQIYLQRCREGRSGSAEGDWLEACELIKHRENGAHELSSGDSYAHTNANAYSNSNSNSNSQSKRNPKR